MTEMPLFHSGGYKPTGDVVCEAAQRIRLGPRLLSSAVVLPQVQATSGTC